MTSITLYYVYGIISYKQHFILMSRTCTIPIFAYIVHSANRLQCTVRTPLIKVFTKWLMFLSSFETVIILMVRRIYLCSYSKENFKGFENAMIRYMLCSFELIAFQYLHSCIKCIADIW